MKLIGLVGGTGWISTVEYYRLINQEVNRRLGGLQSARCIIYSFNYAVIHELNEKYDADGQFSLMLDAATKLISIGAEGIVLTSLPQSYMIVFCSAFFSLTLTYPISTSASFALPLPLP